MSVKKLLYWKWLGPVVLAGIIFVLLGLGVHSKAVTATAYPRYDAMQYFYKAKNVFDSISNDRLVDIMNTPDAFRPPGSALLLYPFGFSTSHTGFYSRSVFVPVIIWFVALFIALHSLGTNRFKCFFIVSICLGACSLPLFYQFETENGISFWGLVDPLFAAVSALAVALLIEGAARRNLLYTMLGWFTAGFSLLVKPAGLVILAGCIGIWGVECIVRRRREFLLSQRFWNTVSYEVQSLLLCVLIYTVILTICLRSKYLGAETLNLFQGGSSIVKEWMTGSGQFLLYFYKMSIATIGPVLIFPLIIVAIVSFVRSSCDMFNRKISLLSIRTYGVLGFVIAATYWWWTMASPQVRYYYPFILIVFLWILRSLAKWILERRRSFQITVQVLAIFPILVINILLWQQNPSFALQKFLKIDLTTSLFEDETRLAERLLKESAKLGRMVRVSIAGSSREGALVAPFQYRYGILGQKKEGISGINLCDWIRSPGIRFDELLNADILLSDKTWITSRPLGLAIRPSSSDVTVRTYHEEMTEFFRFLTNSTSEQGVELYQDGTLAAYRIIDRAAFTKAFTAWAETIKWENDFRERNSAFL